LEPTNALFEAQWVDRFLRALDSRQPGLSIVDSAVWATRTYAESQLQSEEAAIIFACAANASGQGQAGDNP
jgi:hypothetical protein